MDSIGSPEQLDKLLKKQDGLMLIVFYTPSSEKSLQSVRALEQLRKENDDLAVFKVDASETRDIHPRYDIQTVPTVVAFRNGKAAEIIHGVQTAGFYARLLNAPGGSNGQDAVHRVTVYSTPSCPYCNMVKQYLDKNGVSYDEVDVAADPQAAQQLVQRTGQQGVPQTEIDGSFVIGYNTQQIDQLLNL